MQNFRLTIQYDGTRYLGWQRPKKDGLNRTVSWKLMTVLEKIAGEPVTLFAGAKTDPGVHALAQTVSFQAGSGLRADQIRTELNRCLPQDIAVLDCRTAPERFRADLNALSRTYEFRICTAPVYDIFSAGYTAHIYPAPDFAAMRQAVSALIGKHDFTHFSAGRAKKSTVKEIFSVEIESGQEKDLARITVTADDFLCRMPQLVIGTLLETGQGIRTPESIKDILNGRESQSSKVQKAGALCEAKGLLLTSIQYP